MIKLATYKIASVLNAEPKESVAPAMRGSVVQVGPHRNSAIALHRVKGMAKAASVERPEPGSHVGSQTLRVRAYQGGAPTWLIHL